MKIVSFPQFPYKTTFFFIIQLIMGILDKVLNRSLLWPAEKWIPLWHQFTALHGRHAKCGCGGRSSYSCDVTKLEAVASKIKTGVIQRIAVMAGAGISTISGIPDFRSPGTGLYDNLQRYNLPYPEAVFDLDYFFRDPQPFFTLAHELYPGRRYRPNVTHYLVRLLHERGLLQRMYTQNIDGLEALAGIPADSLVTAHGSFTSATCVVCEKKYSGADIEDAIFKQEIPRCTAKDCDGVVKPDIVFFGEQLPPRFWMFSDDLPKCDLLLVMGTSLEVYPFAGIAEAVLPHTPRILFNQEATGSFVSSPRPKDIVMKGDLAATIAQFVSLLGWESDLENLMNSCEENHKA